MLRFAVLLSLFPTLAFASEIHKVSKDRTRILVRQGSEANLQKWDRACFEYEGVRSCGTVQNKDGKFLLVQLSAATSAPEKTKIDLSQNGKKSSMEPLRDVTTVAPTPTAVTEVKSHVKKDVPGIAITGGISVGTNYLLPEIQFHIPFSKKVSLGISGIYAQGETATSAFTALGGWLSGTFAFSGTVYKGFWVEPGAGAYALQIRDGQGANVMAGYLLVGTSVQKGSLLFRLGLGAQYITESEQLPTTNHFAGLLPYSRVQVGWAF